METKEREKRIYRVTLMGSVVNVILLVFKFIAGILGGSAAMIADAVHSLSDFLTDIIIIAFVRISSKPEDEDHDYGHGKYETLATSIIGLALLMVGLYIFYNGARQIWDVMHGAEIEQPGLVALIAAIISILLKEWTYRFTVSVGKKVESQAVIANAWHHRSDALSSIGTAIGIGGAILLGKGWAVLDPVAALVVSVFIVKTALGLLSTSSGELLEKSLPKEVEKKIVDIVESEPEVSEVHHLCTRRIGNNIAIEMHIRMPGEISLKDSHTRASNIERMLRQHFGEHTHINLHVEPLNPKKKREHTKQCTFPIFYLFMIPPFSVLV
ncbi:cation diffusion facilitator family transporter [uncultured Prevotella sp.]|uniref:cation diffusion facilitator family transporter n=1 Tax=uncultured Prevotella sp. TaxID=159272 RepID=UPI0026260801|nr:cation diffusion facilitator family transporter [uncultured Prevotella sp.]